MSTDSMEVDNNTVNSKNDTDIDEGLYSRQLYVLGHEAMKRMGSSNILIVGLKGLGVEIAKNVILAGVKSVTLHDDEPATIADLTSQFFLTEKDVGKPRAKSVVEKLAELNNYVAVEVHTGKLTPEALSKFQVVVMVSQPFNLQLEVNEYCHNNGIRFISTDNKGVFSYIFDDFGKNFEVIDPNGEAPISLVITHVSQENPAIITVNEDQRIPFEDGDYVTFSEVMGMTELNSVVPRKIKILSHFTFSIEEDATKYSAYTGGGYATQVKKSITLDFLKLKESMENPEFLVSDFGKFDSPPQLHLGFLALDEFAKKNESLPHPHNDDHAKQVVEIAKQINSNLPKKLVEEVNEKLITSLSYVAQGDFAPLVAFLGGFAAQEVLKACSGKFTPIKQWFYFDAIEALPKDAPADEFKPLGTRYDGQIITLGKTLHDKITQLSYFLVGAGAIGCEVLKIWAMMGLGTAQGSCIHVTDMDSIEKSNLNRQFLFRPKDVEQLKSTTAANAVKQMNPQLNVKAYSTRVGVETESVFNDAFFNSLFGVCNALDNIDARLYMDSRCVFYKKPLLESGTLGTKGNTQVVIPHLTESYASSRDPPEKSIPFCTLHHFPNTIEHCIQWARDLFEGFFRNQAETVNTYLSTPGFLESLQKQSGGMKLETLNILKKCLVDEKPANFDQCVVWARLKFEEYFNNNIQQLLYNFPLDMITSSGAPFWSGPKRAPKPIKFNPDDSTHLLFVIAAAKLRAENFGIKYSIDPAVVRKSVNNVVVPEFVPKKGVHITTNESDKKDQSQEQATEDDDEIIKKLLQEIPPPNKLAGYKMNPVEFEKDKDDNFHIDFITATANMRAANYSIPQADKHKCKGIAGKIIPAMVTTTAVVSGLVNIELVKLVQNRPITDFKNGFVNLALPFCAFSEPIAPPSTKVREGWSWTLWDRFEVDGDLTMKEFLDYFKNKHQLEITMISCGVSMIYAFYMGKDKLAERMNKKMTEVVSMVNKQPIPETKNHLTFEVCANRMEDDEEVDVPFVKLTFRK